METSNFTRDQGLLKIKQYCAYQERCRAEVIEKLITYGLYKKDVEEIIGQLIEENYLNEQRFATQFAGGKFRLKQWGKIKIKHALKQKRVSEYCIKNALGEIAEHDYHKTVRKLAAQKIKTFKSEDGIFNRKRKLHHYLLQKGYESTIIKQVIHEEIR